MALIKENRVVADFDEIRAELNGEVYISQGESESLVIEADEEIMPRLKSEVIAGRLELGLRSWFDIFSLVTHPTIRYWVTVKNLRGAALSGSGKVIVNGPLAAERLRLKLSGSGEFQVPQLETGNLEIDFSGSGKAEIAGKASRIDLGISGSGNMRAEDLECQDARVRISGSSSVRLNVQTRLEVNISGSGEVRYRGQPAIEHRISGSGSIRPL